jgi:sulfite exporter TauE/SafE
LALRIAIPEGVVSLFEFAAGIMLIILGILVLKSFGADKIHMHPHGNGANTQAPAPSQVDSVDKSHAHVYKSAFTGVIQGMAGSAALMLVTLTTVNSMALGLVFILAFGVGVILGMISIACLISSLLTYAASHLEKDA